MEKFFQIAIDGPGGAGKSTIAKAVAQKLGIEYIDTGAMYRVLGLKMLKNGMEFKDSSDLRMLLDNTSIDFRDGDIFLDGEPAGHLIRTQEVSMAASACSAIPAVRKKMVEAQQKMGESKNVIMDGRDICEVVFPQAQFKFFVTADTQERARRRFEELKAKGENVTFEQVLAQIKERDLNDSTREASPMRQADDAELLDTTDMTAEQAADYICEKVRKTVK